MNKYDIAAFVWPAYSGDDPRTRIFWPDGIGEWESVKSAKPKFNGHTWPRAPLWGYVNEGDSKVMEMEINAAVNHGINVFIYDWYWFDSRPFLENSLNDGFLKAKNNEKMKFYLMWANHNVNYIWDKRNSDKAFEDSIEKSRNDLVFTGEVSREQFEKIADRMITKYFSKPNYYRIDGKPVLMIYCLPVLVKGLGGIENTRDALLWFKERCCEAGLGGLHLQFDVEWFCSEVFDGERIMTLDEVAEYFSFDSATNYQMKNLSVSGIDSDYATVAKEAEASWYKLAEENKFPYFPQVSVGWDNNPRFHKPKKILKGSSPEEFAKALRAAKNFVDKHPENPPLITVNSWNEWTEGSYLEPDNVTGYGYLEAVKNIFKEI